ncbi:flagellar hook protein FlgE [Desulfofundulus luciae]|uniref:Flagellar hook protein FlgE n=1 Tax=Desulfofundulus luciae TaxID=74702 RepID=A0ABU0AYN8_9FIRM|nr:flagellar hook-basal body complex protein [Desulfofundulus luciae]MDQ0285585.1 flagellar hook protein FlgE [Desulfofundulus luciae]
MIRSLFAGVAGMKNHQIRMDVIANNISNVNTVGFKSGRANFQDVLYQTLKSAGTSTNPAQVGLGVSLAGISSNMSPGGLQSTGRTLDLAINGEGFFKVIDPGSGKEYYTRDGVFYIDQNGYVVNSSGYRLVGELRNITAARSTEVYSKVDVSELQVTGKAIGTGDGSTTTFSLGYSPVVDGSVKVYLNGTPTTDFSVNNATGEITFNTAPGAGVNITADYQKATSSLILKVTGKDGPLGKRTDFTIDTARKADINAGESYSIAANATNQLSTLFPTLAVNDEIVFNLKNNYTNENISFKVKVAAAADLANGIVSTTSTLDDFKTALSNAAAKAGAGGKIEMYYTDNGNEVTAASLDGDGNEGFGFRTADCGPKVSLSITVKDGTGAPKNIFTGTNSGFIDGFASASGTGDDVDTIIAKINAQTANVGVRASKDEQNRLVLRTVYTGTDAEIEIGGDAAAYLGLPSGIVKNPGNTYTGAIQLINGPAASLNISNDGVITGTDSNGNMLEWEDGTATVTNADFAQINLYTFSNQDGLQRVNKNLFVVSESSGTPTPGKPGSAGYGTIESGYLEMSNVDLTDEFTNMITTQRGYQASARIITVSDTMLDELINLKR